MTNADTVTRLNSHRHHLPFLVDMGCEVTGANSEERTCEMTFEIGERYCHSGDIIQGGFVTAMLDAVTTHAVFAADSRVTAVSTLEVKVSFLDASRMGKLKAVGRVDKLTRNFAFLSGDLFNSAGDRTAGITATAKVSAADR